MTDNTIFDIEKQLFAGNHNESAKKIHELFIGFRKGHHFGKLNDTDKVELEVLSAYTRIAACIADLFLNCNGYCMNEQIFLMWQVYAREVRASFVISGYYTSDFIIGILDATFKAAVEEHSKGIDRKVDIEQIAMRLLLFSMLENNLQIEYKAFIEMAPYITLASILSLMSATVVLSKQAFAIREKLLDQLEKLQTTPLKESITLLDMSVVWMMCSYMQRRDKHKAKLYINSNIKNWIKEYSIGKNVCKAYEPNLKKPIMILGLEFFRSSHSMGRSYGVVIRSLREKFYLIGLALQEAEITDDHYKAFDKIVTINCTDSNGVICPVRFRAQMKKIARLNADIIFYPSLGMHLNAIVMANMRLAPIQIVGAGHPASTFCEDIDYMVLEHDFAPRHEELHSEKVVTIPAESIISQPLEACRGYKRLPYNDKREITIGISSVIPKISSPFLLACKKIGELSKRPIKFMFFVNDTELFYLQAKKEILAIVPNAHVFHRMPGDAYVQYLSSCDLYLSSFPFGGANSVIDGMCVGLPIVCLKSDDIAGLTDSALLSRRHVPEWLITHSEEEYVNAALKLIHNDSMRETLSDWILQQSTYLWPENNEKYQNTKESLCEAMWQIYKKHTKLKESKSKFFTLEELKTW